MTIPIPLALADMSPSQAMAYHYRLLHMQGLLSRHHSWRISLAAGLILTLAGLAYGVLSASLWLICLGLILMAVLPGLLLMLPARLQERYQRDIATLLRDLPPARDSQPPSLKEISRLLQSPEAFERTLSDWLCQEAARCATHDALSVSH